MADRIYPDMYMVEHTGIPNMGIMPGFSELLSIDEIGDVLAMFEQADSEVIAVHTYVRASGQTTEEFTEMYPEVL